MNIYDTKIIHCTECGKNIGEVDYDAEIIFPKCGNCANPMPTIPDLPQHIFSLNSNEKESRLLIH